MHVGPQDPLGLQAGCSLQPISSLFWCWCISFSLPSVSCTNMCQSPSCTCKSCFFQARHMKHTGLWMGSWGTAPATQRHSSRMREYDGTSYCLKALLMCLRPIPNNILLSVLRPSWQPGPTEFHKGSIAIPGSAGGAPAQFPS